MVTINVVPAELPQDVRESISVRMLGNVVHQAMVAPDFEQLKLVYHPDDEARLVAPTATLEGLLEAIREDDARIAPQISHIHRGFELIRKSGVRLSAENARRYACLNYSGEDVVLLEKLLQDPTDQVELKAPKSPELN